MGDPIRWNLGPKSTLDECILLFLQLTIRPGRVGEHEPTPKEQMVPFASCLAIGQLHALRD